MEATKASVEDEGPDAAVDAAVLLDFADLGLELGDGLSRQLKLLLELGDLGLEQNMTSVMVQLEANVFFTPTPRTYTSLPIDGLAKNFFFYMDT